MSRQSKAEEAQGSLIKAAGSVSTLAVDLPSFTELFGDIDQAEGLAARSVLSPAAYLVDLLQLRDSVVDDVPGSDTNDYHQRRPDVAEIPLDEVRTFGEVPHLEISNAVMKTLAERDLPGDVREQLASAIFPAPLPYSQDHARLSLYLRKLGVEASELYRRYQRPVDGLTVARLRLGLSEPELALFTTPRASDAGIAELWGVRDEAERAALLAGELPLVQRKLGFTLKQLKALLYQDLSDAELAGGVAADFFLNQDPDHAGAYLTIVDGDPQDPAALDHVRWSDGSAWGARQLDRLMRFVRVMQRLGLSAAELDWVLRSASAAEFDGAAVQALAIALELRKASGLSLEEVCALWAVPKRHGHGDGAEPADLFDRVFNAGYSVRLEELLAQGPSEALTSRLAGALRLARGELDLLVAALAARGVPYAATLAYVSLLYRLTTLARALSLRAGELVAVLDVLDAQWRTAEHDELAVTVPVLAPAGTAARPSYAALAAPEGAAGVAAAQLVVQRLWALRQWAERRALSARQLAYLCLERFDDGAAIDGVAADGALESALGELHGALSALLVSPAELQTGSLSQRGAAEVFAALRGLGVLVVVAGAASEAPRALVRTQPQPAELEAALQRGVEERLEVYAGELRAVGVASDEVAGVLALLASRGYLEPAGGGVRVARGAHEFFLDRSNLPSFYLPEVGDRQEALFSALSEKVAGYRRAGASLAAEAAELGSRLLAVVEQQMRALQRVLATQLAVADELAGFLFELVFGTPAESPTESLAALTVPLFEVKASEGSAGRVLGRAAVALAMRRLRQLALVFGKAGLGAAEAKAFAENQALHPSRPDPLKLPSDFFDAAATPPRPVKIDGITALPGGEVAVLSGSRYAAFSGADYRLLGTGELAQLPGVSLPVAFHGGLDAAWRDADGTYYFASGDSFVSVAGAGAPTTAPVRLAERWGKVRNHVQEQQRLDAALLDASGRVFLFRGDQYLRYADAGRLLAGPAFADEGYPKSIAGSFESEGVMPLPGVMHARIDAAFRDRDGSYVFFAGDRFVRSTAPFALQEVKSRWGKVRNHLFDDDRVDAAFVHGDHTYLIRRDQLVRYSGPAYRFVDETFPKSFGNLAESDALLRVLRRFPAGVEATLVGRDSALYVFGQGSYASSAEPELRRPIGERWGRVRNQFVDHARVDAALRHGGKSYLFCGDQYVRYSGLDYQHVDEGYPKRVRGNWNQLEDAGVIPEQLAEPISAVATGTSGELYFFAGTQYAAPSGTRSEIALHWGRVRNELERLGRVDAALVDGAGRLYLFTGDQLHRYSSPDQELADEGYPLRLATGWPMQGAGWAVPAAFEAGISAALRTPDDRTYFFAGQQYARVDAAGAPASIGQHWGLVRNTLAASSRVDAAFRDPQGRTYLFRDDQFVRYSAGYDGFVDEGFPLAIGTRWGALPAAFQSGIDAALTYVVDGVPRLYLFRGRHYVRYSTSDYSQIDAGYPKLIADGDNVEGSFFRGFAVHDPDHGGDHDDIDLASIHVDTFAARPRITLFYWRDGGGDQWQREYRYENNRFRWTNGRKVSSLSEYQPYTQFSASLVAQDGTLHLFSGEVCTTRPAGGGALTPPVQIRERWGKVRNRFTELGRIDATLTLPDGRTYLFCDDQFSRYSGTLRPGDATFTLDEGYPRTTASQFGAEGVPVTPPAVARPQGFALCRDAAGRLHIFDGAQYTYGGNPQAPVPVASRWGKVENRIAQLSRIDAALRADNEKLYLFCDDQFTRYSVALTPGTPEFYADEGYPRRVATGWPGEGVAVALPPRFFALGSALLADGQDLYVFSGDSFTSAQQPAPRPLLAHWARVRNQLQAQGRVDAGVVLQRGTDTVTLLFCDDQYVRYSAGYDGYVDEGYPKAIARLSQVEGITAWPAELQPGVSAVFAGRDGALHAFSRVTAPGQAQRYVASTAPDVLRAPRELWGIIDNQLFDRSFVDAALTPTGGRLYLFSGDQYVRYSDSAQEVVDEGYPRKVSTGWASELGVAELPAVLAQGLDAALALGDTQFYFVGDQVVDSRALLTPRPLVERWGRVDNRLQETSRVDAALLAPSGALLLFTGDQVTLYSGARRDYVDEGYPKVLAGSLGQGWPAAFQRDLDSACAFEGRTYLYKGGEHVRLSDLRLRTPDQGYPRPIVDKWLDRRDLTLGALPEVWSFAELAESYASPPLTLLEYLALPAPTVEQLAAMTRWSAAEISLLLASPLAPGGAADRRFLSTVLPGSGLGDVRTLAALARHFAFAESAASTPSNLRLQLSDKAYGAGPRELGAAAEVALGLVKAKTSSAEWPAVLKSLRDPIHAATRDALVAYLLHARSLREANDLYEYLLHDVSMGQEATTSPIVEAIASIQLYYHRALMNLEEVPAELRAELGAWWAWMKNYRTWEANRRVFLYPENYVRPELRTVKSPGFEELEQNLLQDEITEAAAEKAYTTYLDKFAEVSRLRIAGGYVYRDDRGEAFVAVFGFARTEPLTYYFRRGKLPEQSSVAISWEPWRKLEISINAERVQPVFAFNRLFLFWLEPQTTNDTEFRTGGTYGGQDAPETAKPIIKYSFYNINEEWITPQTLRAELRKDLRDGKRERSWLTSDLQAGRLYVTNPSLSGEYDPEAYVYVLASLKDMADPLVGRLTAALDFEPRSAIDQAEARAIIASIDLLPAFPARLGLAPESFARWGAHFQGVMTAPWFSFDASGGSFLCRPAEPTPISRYDVAPAIELRGKLFSKVATGFGLVTGELHVFAEVGERMAYHRHGAPEGGGPAAWQPPVFPDSTRADGSPAWPAGLLRRFFAERPQERVQEAINAAGVIYLVTTGGTFTYSASPYRFVDQAYEALPQRPSVELLVGDATMAESWQSLFDGSNMLGNAFARDGYLVLVVRAAGGERVYAEIPLAELRAYATALPGAPAGLFENWSHLDTAFVEARDTGQHVTLTHGNSVVRLRWQDQVWSVTDLGAFGVSEPSLSAAFGGPDGMLYFFSADRYAAITPGVAVEFRPVAERWAHFPPMVPEAALVGTDSRLYLFAAGYCLRYSSPLDGFSWQLDAGFPRRLSEVWGTAFSRVTAAFRLGTQVFLFGQRDGQARYERYSAMPATGVFAADPTYPKPVQGSWGNLPTSFNLGFDAAIGLVGGELGDELVLTEGDQRISYGGDSGRQLYEVSEVKYAIVRLTSNTAARFSQLLLGLGVPGLLSLGTQKTQELPRFSTNPLDRGQAVVVCRDTRYLTDYPDKPTTPPRGPALDFESANGFYYWEIFFHIPYLIAQALNQAQRFAEARTWYEHVFDPTEQATAADARPYWKFLPFHDATDGRDQSYLEDPDQLSRYRDDPFDPHGLAQLRPVAYRKAFVMSYIDNLLDWGDLLFQQYTRESIGEAVMLYVLAANLLGKRPDELGKRKLALPTKSYAELRDELPLDEELLALERELPPTPPSFLDAATPNDSILNPYFFIPENEQFIDYWRRVEDRLFKVRNGLNLDGVKQSLSLFAPPVDVLALVKAFASGAGLAQALSDYNAAVPHYRCTFLMAKARELIGRVTQLGGALLSALEKQDAEELNLLRNTQERGILEMTLDIKQQQLEAARQSAAGLRASLNSARTRQAYYRRMLAEGLSGYEIWQLVSMSIGQGLTTASSAMNFVAAGASLVPNVGSPFAITYGGQQLGPSVKAISEALKMGAEQYSFMSSLASLLGGWDRRRQEWELQRDLSGHDIEQITRQINAADIQVEIARQEIQVQRRQIRNNQSIDTFMRSKFTSQQLYRWMVGKLSALYFQTYQLALDYAKAAARALQFEQGWTESEALTIGAYYWDSLRKGLLAGEQLQLDLDRMEKTYLDKNKRRFEITKTVSLLLTDPLALINLQQKGSCEFELSEALFDQDFPGHYCRQIKTLSVSFPAVVGPYENFNATLTQLGNRTLLRPDLDGVKYLLTGEGELPGSLRFDWRPTQQVALSRGVNDSGLFQLNYQDERFLPFEGTGAVSRWRLEINGVDGLRHREQLRDVIVTVQYTALAGGDDFGDKVKSALPATARARVFNLAYDQPEAWQAFLRDPARGLKLSLERAQLPGATSSEILGVYLHYELTEDGAGAIGRQALRLETSGGLGPELAPETLHGDLRLPLGAWTLTPTARADRFTAANLRNIALVLIYMAKAAF